MRRFGILALVALMIIVPTANPVSAGKGWCRSDPIVSLNGVELQFWVAIPEEYQDKVAGPINIALIAPRSTQMQLIYTDSGFNGYGESVNLAASGAKIAADGTFTVKAIVSVPMIGNQFIPMQIEVVPDAGGSVFVEGETVGVVITLSLQGETIADILAHGGVVLPTVPSIADLLPTSMPSPTTFPSETLSPTAIATDVPADVPTNVSTTVPPDEPTVEPTATEMATDVVTEEASATLTGTAVPDESSDDGSATVLPDDATEQAELIDEAPVVSPTEEEVQAVEFPTEASGDDAQNDAEATANAETNETNEETTDGETTLGDKTDDSVKDDSLPDKTPPADTTDDGNDGGLTPKGTEDAHASESTEEAVVTQVTNSNDESVVEEIAVVEEEQATEELVEIVETVVIVETPTSHNDDQQDEQENRDDEHEDDKTPTPKATSSPTMIPSPSATSSDQKDD